MTVFDIITISKVILKLLSHLFSQDDELNKLFTFCNVMKVVLVIIPAKNHKNHVLGNFIKQMHYKKLKLLCAYANGYDELSNIYIF